MRQIGTKLAIINGQEVEVKIYATSMSKLSPQVRKKLRPEPEVTVTYEPEEADLSALPLALKIKHGIE
jgi:hypothetical protein